MGCRKGGDETLVLLLDVARVTVLSAGRGSGPLGFPVDHWGSPPSPQGSGPRGGGGAATSSGHHSRQGSNRHLVADVRQAQGENNAGRSGTGRTGEDRNDELV